MEDKNIFDMKKNKEWKDRWLPFIQYDYDFDGLYIISLIVHKLKLIKEHYQDEALVISKKDKNRIIRQVNEVLELGEGLLTQSYDEPLLELVDKKTNEEVWDETSRRCKKEKKNMNKKFFSLLAKYYEGWWD